MDQSAQQSDAGGGRSLCNDEAMNKHMFFNRTMFEIDRLHAEFARLGAVACDIFAWSGVKRDATGEAYIAFMGRAVFADAIAQETLDAATAMMNAISKCVWLQHVKIDDTFAFVSEPPPDMRFRKCLAWNARILLPPPYVSRACVNIRIERKG